MDNRVPAEGNMDCMEKNVPAEGISAEDKQKTTESTVTEKAFDQPNAPVPSAIPKEESIPVQPNPPEVPKASAPIPPVQTVFTGIPPIPISPTQKCREQLLKSDAKVNTLALLGVLWVVCAFLANTLLYTGIQGVLLPAAVVLLYAVFYLFRGADSIQKDLTCIAMQVLIVLVSFGFLVNHESLTNTVTLLALLAVIPIHLLYCTGKSHPQTDGFSVISKALQIFFPFALRNLDIPIRKSANRPQKGESHVPVKQILRGLLCTVPFLIIFCLLFAGGDDAFARSLSSLFHVTWNADILLLIVSIVIGACLAVYLCALFLVLRTETEHEEFRKKQRGRLSAASVSSFLSVLIALELYFSFIQVKYLFLHLGELPEGEGYADYARSGFFEIAAATLLTMGLILAVTVLTKRLENGALPTVVKILLTVFSGCVLLMFASSYYRMFMYIGAYSMTVKRVAVCWLMALLLLILAGVIVYIWKPSFRLMRYTVFTVLVCVLILNGMNIGYTVPKSNVDRYLQEQSAEEKSGYNLDTGYLRALLPASAPALRELENTPAWDAWLQNDLFDCGEQIADMPLRGYSADVYRAKQACADVEQTSLTEDYVIYIQIGRECVETVQEIGYTVYAAEIPVSSGSVQPANGGYFRQGESVCQEISVADLPDEADFEKISVQYTVYTSLGSFDLPMRMRPNSDCPTYYILSGDSLNGFTM